MSEQVDNNENEGAIQAPPLDTLDVPKCYYRPDPRIKWDAAETEFGPLDSVDISVPVTVDARVDVWAVPKDEQNPEGYWVSVNNCTRTEGVEPGYPSWQKHLIARFQMMGDSLYGNTYEVDGSKGPASANYIERNEWLERLGLNFDEEAFNPTPTECLNYVMRQSVHGHPGDECVFDGKFGGDNIPKGTIVQITPEKCSCRGFKNHPGEIKDGETYEFTVDDAETANEELKDAVIICGDVVTAVHIKMTPGITKDFVVNGSPTPVKVITDETGRALSDEELAALSPEEREELEAKTEARLAKLRNR